MLSLSSALAEEDSLLVLLPSLELEEEEDDDEDGSSSSTERSHCRTSLRSRPVCLASAATLICRLLRPAASASRAAVASAASCAVVRPAVGSKKDLTVNEEVDGDDEGSGGGGVEAIDSDIESSPWLSTDALATKVALVAVSGRRMDARHCSCALMRERGAREAGGGRRFVPLTTTGKPPLMPPPLLSHVGRPRFLAALPAEALDVSRHAALMSRALWMEIRREERGFVSSTTREREEEEEKVQVESKEKH